VSKKGSNKYSFGGKGPVMLFSKKMMSGNPKLFTSLKAGKDYNCGSSASMIRQLQSKGKNHRQAANMFKGWKQVCLVRKATPNMCKHTGFSRKFRQSSMCKKGRMLEAEDDSILSSIGEGISAVGSSIYTGIGSMFGAEGEGASERRLTETETETETDADADADADPADDVVESEEDLAAAETDAVTDAAPADDAVDSEEEAADLRELQRGGGNNKKAAAAAALRRKRAAAAAAQKRAADKKKSDQKEQPEITIKDKESSGSLSADISGGSSYQSNTDYNRGGNQGYYTTVKGPDTLYKTEKRHGTRMQKQTADVDAHKGDFSSDKDASRTKKELDMNFHIEGLDKGYGHPSKGMMFLGKLKDLFTGPPQQDEPEQENAPRQRNNKKWDFPELENIEMPKFSKLGLKDEKKDDKKGEKKDESDNKSPIEKQKELIARQDAINAKGAAIIAKQELVNAKQQLENAKQTGSKGAQKKAAKDVQEAKEELKDAQKAEKKAEKKADKLSGEGEDESKKKHAR